jgi:signal transduction histidine kinase
MNSRKGIYFAFQGLLMAVLLLIFLYKSHEQAEWLPRFAVLLAATVGSLTFIRLAPLSRGWAQVALFLGDALLATLTMSWSQRNSNLFLIYIVILLGTALTRSWRQSLFVALVTSGLYLAAPGSYDEIFWLRFLFIWVIWSLLTILSLDTQETELRHRERTVQYERLAAIGQLAAEVAHRIKGPLTTIKVNAEVLAHKYKAPGAAKELEQIQEEVDRCRDVLRNLLNLGRIEELDLVALDLAEPVRLALSTVESRLKKQGVKVRAYGLDQRIPVLGDQSMLQEAAAALLHNAVDAKPRRLTVRLSADRRWASVEIEDDGRGIARADLERVFQPFFTTKGPEGTGLGLSAALRIMQKHGGTLEAHSDGPGRGALFRLALPLGKTS